MFETNQSKLLVKGNFYDALWNIHNKNARAHPNLIYFQLKHGEKEEQNFPCATFDNEISLHS